MLRISYSNSLRKLNVALASFLLASSAVFAQNLVINPSFEDVNFGSLNCSWYTSVAQYNAAINNWTLPTGGSTDIFNTFLATSCYCSPFSTHTSSPGTQAPRTGNGFCNIVTYGNGGCTPWREYLQGQLSSPMVVGQTYEVEFWVTLADKMSKGTNNIGVKFNTNPYTQGGNCPYYTTPDLNYLGPIILDKANWVQILFTYTPTVAGLDNFVIGNFYNDPATSWVAASGVTTGNTIRYFVDDVRIEPVNPLPVELVDFTAECSEYGTLLNWTTLTESNNDFFTIERSMNSVDFIELNQINGAGNSTTENNYNYRDSDTKKDFIYYRLKQTDFDGNHTYSKVITTDCQADMRIYPNPTSNELYLEFNDNYSDAHSISISSIDSKSIQVEIDLSRSSNIYKIDAFSSLSKGIYIVQVKNHLNEVIYVERVMKN